MQAFAGSPALPLPTPISLQAGWLVGKLFERVSLSRTGISTRETAQACHIPVPAQRRAPWLTAAIPVITWHKNVRGVL